MRIPLYVRNGPISVIGHDQKPDKLGEFSNSVVTSIAQASP
jgi:hypothetical protein